MLLGLQEMDYFIEYKTHISGEVTHLFFAHPKSIKLFKCYPEVLIMDCTYKTNWFHALLLNIISTIALGISFFVGFAFIAEKTNEDYLWAIKELKTLMYKENINDPAVVVTDYKLALIYALKKVFL
jgi:MULE transposase domain